MPKASYRHFLKFYLRGETEPFIAEVREQEAARFMNVLEWTGDEERREPFFCFESVDGRSIAVNTRFLQAAHMLWEPSLAPPDRVRYEGPIVISLRGRKERIETGVSAPAELCALFFELEDGLGPTPFASFEDEDGERLIINPAEVVFVTAPAHVLHEGRQMAEQADDPL